MKPFFPAWCALTVALVVPALPREAAASATVAYVGDLGTQTPHTFTIGPASWRDPSVSNAGWTHNSQWGYFNGVAGQSFVLTVDTSAAGFHPGVTIWKNPLANDTVGGDFYPQNGNFLDSELFNPTMTLETFGYDADGAVVLPALNPVSDGDEGHLAHQFTLTQSGFFSVVVGGIAPAAGVTGFKQATVTLQTAAPVPLPAAVWLFGSGLLGLTGAGLRRRTSA